MSSPTLRRLFDLPLGSVFRYAHQATAGDYVLLGYGDNGLVCDAPKAEGSRAIQGLYSAAESRGEFEALMVEFVPMIEASQHEAYKAGSEEAFGAVVQDKADLEKRVRQIEGTIDAQQRVIATMRGQRQVLALLLAKAIDVVKTVEAEGSTEGDMLAQLIAQAEKALADLYAEGIQAGA